MTARMSPAESIPTPRGGPWKSGTFFSQSGVDNSMLRTTGTRTNIPHTPYTIEGTAARSSVRKMRGCFRRWGESSERKIAIPRAMGVEITSAMSDE